MNQVALVGRLAADPEMKYTTGGKAVANFKIAVSRTVKNAEGRYDADFFPVVAWEKSAEYVSTYGAKGRLASVGGRLQTRNYENQAGVRVYVTEIMANQVSFLDKREEGAETVGKREEGAEIVGKPLNPPVPKEDDFSDPFEDN